MHSARLGHALLAVLAILAGCTQAPPTSEPLEAPRFSALESSYDRAKWRWVRNPDGRSLLTHTEIGKCFIDPQPPLDFHDAGFTLKRSEKTIGRSRYEIVSAYDKNDFWEAVYVRAGSKTPILGVYAPGRCQEEAELILQAYEQGVTR